MVMETCAHDSGATSFSHFLDGIDLSMALVLTYLGDTFQQQSHLFWMLECNS